MTAGDFDYAIETMLARDRLNAPANGLGVVSVDLNGDGLPEIYLANDGEPNLPWELLAFELPEALDVLAAAQAEAGRFAQASETARRARDLALRAGDSGLVMRIGDRLALYKAGRPYREGIPEP